MARANSVKPGSCAGGMPDLPLPHLSGFKSTFNVPFGRQTVCGEILEGRNFMSLKFLKCALVAASLGLVMPDLSHATLKLYYNMNNSEVSGNSVTAETGQTGTLTGT